MAALFLVYMFAICLLGSDSKLYRSIIWSPDNPIFKQSKLKCVFPKSRQYILCPSLSMIVSDRDELPIKEHLYENLWFVDRQAYDSCQVNKAGRLLKRCDTPLIHSQYDIMFLEMNPISGELEFELGKDYYVIATSNGTQSSLSNRAGGHCKTNDMKLRFHVCADNKDPHCLNEENCQQLLYKPSDPGGTPTSATPHPTRVGAYCNTTNVTPTTPYETVPPSDNRKHYFASIEVYYRLGLGLSVPLCIIFASTTACLAIRLYRVKTRHCIQDKDCAAVRLSCASNGSTTVDANADSCTLMTKRESEITI